MNRRDFLKTIAAIGGTGLVAAPTRGAETPGNGYDPYGVLVDTTRCVGCRTCEMMCAEAHGLPEPNLDDDSVFERERTPSVTQWTVVNRYQTEKGEFYVKRQCFHCLVPACANSCLTKAMYKTRQGPVIWRESKCMGCRYCMVSCPFDLPRFEYDKPVPKIQKCVMCYDRILEGKVPVCVENCPAEALKFGRRSELIEEAKTRIYQNPDSYEHYIYGEQEAGGTSWLYLAAVPFDQLGFRTDIEKRPYPEFTKEFLYSVPVVDIALPAFLLGLYMASRPDRRDEIADEE